MNPTQEQVREYTNNHGANNTELAWILSPFDTWEANPHYTGPEVPHPESMNDEEDWNVEMELDRELGFTRGNHQNDIDIPF